jgi:Fe-S oxidoreductase
MGDGVTYKKLEQKNTDLFIKAGVKNLLTNSPHCLNTFCNNYPELTGSVKTIHYTSLLHTLIRQNTLKPLGEVNLKVTYHDPCYLGRYNRIYEEPRQILTSIPGIELVEMDSNKEQSLCCGGGGSGVFKKPLSQVSFGEIRIREALKTGADVIVTACPYCIRMLNEAIRKSRVRKKIVVQDVAELLVRSVSQRAEDSVEAPKEVIVNGTG